jgi:hypothetical protein
MSILKSGRSPPFSPSPGQVIGGGSWRVVTGVGGSWRVIWCVPTQGSIVFCLVLLSYMTSRLYSCYYILSLLSFAIHNTHDKTTGQHKNIILLLFQNKLHYKNKKRCDLSLIFWDNQIPRMRLRKRQSLICFLKAVQY